MLEKRTRTVPRTVARTLLGGLVVLLAVPTGVGPVAGGWIASRELESQRHGVVASAVTGLFGAMPWTALTFLATSGAIEPIGYHEGVVHVGVQTASPETFVLWQEISVAVLIAVTVVALSVAGGILAGLLSDSVWNRHSERLQ